MQQKYIFSIFLAQMANEFAGAVDPDI